MIENFLTVLWLLITAGSALAFLKAVRLKPGQTWSWKLLGTEILTIRNGPPEGQPLLEAGSSEAEEPEEEEPEEEEPDERMLAERLDDAGFTLVEAREAPEIDDIGSVFYDEENGEGDCPAADCPGDLYPFGEIIGEDLPGAFSKVGRALRNRYGSACDQCGRLSVTETFAPQGRFGPLIEDGLDLFALIRRFEDEKNGEKAKGEDAKLAARQLELEGELNELKLRRHGLALTHGAVEPFREALPPAVEDDRSDKS